MDGKERFSWDEREKADLPQKIRNSQATIEGTGKFARFISVLHRSFFSVDRCAVSPNFGAVQMKRVLSLELAHKTEREQGDYEDSLCLVGNCRRDLLEVDNLVRKALALFFEQQDRKDDFGSREFSTCFKSTNWLTAKLIWILARARNVDVLLVRGNSFNCRLHAVFVDLKVRKARKAYKN